MVLRYVDDPNGSQGRAAAVSNAVGNVVGIMPHPERAVEALLGSTDGRILLESFLSSMQGDTSPIETAAGAGLSAS